MILLDTQALVWFASGDVRLGEAAREIIKDEASVDGIAVSPISFWEVAMLSEKGRISLGLDVSSWTETVLAQPEMRLQQVDPVIAVDAGRLPGDIHGDPADRLIIATARYLNCPLATTDRKILAYAKAGHLQAIDARH